MYGTPHPDDLELLDLVEGDLPRERADEIRAHVERCTLCERAVHELQAGRAATHTAARLELPPEARDRITDAIGREPIHPRRRLGERLGRAIPVLAAVVVLGSLAGIAYLEVRSPGSSDEATAEGSEAEGAQDHAGSGGGVAAPETTNVAASVAGPPRAVARALREDGYEARVVGSRVLVSGAELEAVAESLAGRRPGPVRVFVNP